MKAARKEIQRTFKHVSSMIGAYTRRGSRRRAFIARRQRPDGVHARVADQAQDDGSHPRDHAGRDEGPSGSGRRREDPGGTTRSCTTARPYLIMPNLNPRCVRVDAREGERLSFGGVLCILSKVHHRAARTREQQDPEQALGRGGGQSRGEKRLPGDKKDEEDKKEGDKDKDKEAEAPASAAKKPAMVALFDPRLLGNYAARDWG